MALAVLSYIGIASASCRSKELRALILTGQNNHNWRVSSAMLRDMLVASGRFHVEVALSPAEGQEMGNFNPEFAMYDVVVLDYNGSRWSHATDSAFMSFVRNGGGVVIYHAADNAFADWDAYNHIIALGGWGGRDEHSGPYHYWCKDHLVADTTAGWGGSHGAQREYAMHCRDTLHPITRGLPSTWMHGCDELYDRMRGPGNIASVLYTATSDSLSGGSGREEPLVFTVDYRRARIVHLMIGHAGSDASHSPALQCVGFRTLLQRSAEWAATGHVRQPIPDNFPTSSQCRLQP